MTKKIPKKNIPNMQNKKIWDIRWKWDYWEQLGFVNFFREGYMYNTTNGSTPRQESGENKDSFFESTEDSRDLALKALDESIQSIEELPPIALQASLNHYDMLSILYLIKALVHQPNDQA